MRKKFFSSLYNFVLQFCISGDAFCDFSLFWFWLCVLDKEKKLHWRNPEGILYWVQKSVKESIFPECFLISLSYFAHFFLWDSMIFWSRNWKKKTAFAPTRLGLVLQQKIYFLKVFFSHLSIEQKIVWENFTTAL